MVYNRLVDHVRELYRRYGYDEVITPQNFDAKLWKTSGHYEHYKENMFYTEVDGREYGGFPGWLSEGRFRRFRVGTGGDVVREGHQLLADPGESGDI